MIRSRQSGPRLNPLGQPNDFDGGPAWILTRTDDGVFLSSGGLQALSWRQARELGELLVEEARRGENEG